MTTTVIVKAHCDPKTTKVRVTTGEKSAPTRDDDVKEYIIDGEEKEYIVHGDKYISVDEVPK